MNSDVQELAANCQPSLTTLSLPKSLARQLLSSKYRIVITGASGWLGQAALEMLSGIDGEYLNKRVRCFGSFARTLKIRDGQSVDLRPLPELPALAPVPTILLHFACLTKEKVSNMPVDDYVAGNRAISETTERAARGIGVERIFLVSSGAVYQALNSRAAGGRPHPYAASKLDDEMLFSSFTHENAARKLLTARLFNLSGPFINKLGSYALASFIEQARGRGRGACIAIKADHSVIRSYVAVENLLCIALAHLLDDAIDSCVSFDTAGDREVEVQELADIVRRVVNPTIAIDRPALTSTVDRYVGDAAVYRSLAARHHIALHDLERQVRDTANYLDALCVG